MKAFYILATTVALTIFSPPLHAHNTMIMPGDGAITTVIEPDKPLKLEEGTLQMGYGFSRYQSLMLCGYLGYGQINIQNIGDQQWDALQTSIRLCKAARKQLHPALKQQLDEDLEKATHALTELPGAMSNDNPNLKEMKRLEDLIYSLKSKKIYIQIFDETTLFCNQYADESAFQTVRPGLRYNETIFSREKSYRSHATYGIDLSDTALAYEWRACNRVKPITLTNKKLFDGAFDADNPPAQVQGSMVCFVVLVGPDPMPYAEGKNMFGYYVVRPDGSIEAYALNGTKLPEEDLAKYPIQLPKEE